MVCGANGAGKSHFAHRLHEVRPDLRLISIDAIKLTTNWQQRPWPDVEARLKAEIDRPGWIIEGGPKALPMVLPFADVMVWLDPPTFLRARRLFLRPLKGIGRTRRELPPGNRDWPFQQYRFALRSLAQSATFREAVADAAAGHPAVRVLRCRTGRDVDAALKVCATAD